MNGLAGYYVSTIGKPHEYFDLTTKPVKNGECLRVSLNTEEDLQFFHDAATRKLQTSEWLGGLQEEELEEAE